MTFSGSLDELIKRSQPPPPNARSFIIGDEIGGTGWQVELADGSIVMYYVEIPSDLPNFDLDVKIYFLEAPEAFRDIRRKAV